MSENLENVQRWTAKRRVALVLSILKGETSTKEAARKHGLTVAEVEDWRMSVTPRAKKSRTEGGRLSKSARGRSGVGARPHRSPSRPREKSRWGATHRCEGRGQPVTVDQAER